MFSGFLDIESEISVQKDFDHVLAMGSWQIPLITVCSVALQSHPNRGK